MDFSLLLCLFINDFAQESMAPAPGFDIPSGHYRGVDAAVATDNVRLRWQSCILEKQVKRPE
jgi:hypothetical protein